MFSKGDKVVQLLIGGGCETASIQEVQHVDKKKKLVFLGDDRDADGVQTFDLDSGRATTDWCPGFTKRLVVLE